MQCHYCDEPAVVAPEHGAVRVGLCRHHLRQHLESLDDALADGLRR
ncbi:MAG: DUF6757 family protein [Halobacteriales archaeon]